MLKTFSVSAGTAPTNKILFTSSGTYTPSAGAIFVKVVVCSGGGGGGCGAYYVTGASGGAGGGGGAYIEEWFPVSALGSSVTCTVSYTHLTLPTIYSV